LIGSLKAKTLLPYTKYLPPILLNTPEKYFILTKKICKNKPKFDKQYTLNKGRITKYSISTPLKINHMQLKCNSCGAVQSLSDTTKCSYCSNEIVIEKAKEFYDTTISSESGSLIMIAETALDGGNNQEAIDYYNKSIEKVLTNSDAWLGKGIATLYSSTLGDIKIMEAISYWKNAIKFATDQNAMQRRVSTIINNTVLTFFPNIENHYAEFHDLKNSYTEFVQKFLLLENALSFAISIEGDNIIVLENGYDLCQKVITAHGRYNKSGASTSFDKETNKTLNKLSKAIENATVPKELYEIEEKYVTALNKLDSTKNLVPFTVLKEKKEEERKVKLIEINEVKEKQLKKYKKYGFLGSGVGFILMFIYSAGNGYPLHEAIGIGLVSGFAVYSFTLGIYGEKNKKSK
jgi:tetratricopeptide (TPR) repeat protein